MRMLKNNKKPSFLQHILPMFVLRRLTLGNDKETRVFVSETKPASDGEQSDMVKERMISDVLAMVTFISNYTSQLAVRHALFDFNGNLISGDDVISVKKMAASNNPNVWFYKVNPIDGYVFIYLPIIPSVAVDFGTKEGSKNPSAEFFRFIDNPMKSITVGGAPNVEVNFMVYGYRAESFLQLKK